MPPTPFYVHALGKIITGLCFFVTFSWLFLLNPLIFLIIVFIYRMVTFKNFSFLFHLVLAFLFWTLCLFSTGQSILIAFGVNRALALFVNALVFSLWGGVFLFTRQNMRRMPSPFVLTAILILVNSLMLTTLSRRTEENLKKILAQSEIRPLVLALDVRNRFYKNFMHYPHLTEGEPTTMAVDRDEKRLFLSTHARESYGVKKSALYRIQLTSPFSIKDIPLDDSRELALDEEAQRLVVANRTKRSLVVVDPEKLIVTQRKDILQDVNKRHLKNKKGPLFIVKNLFFPENLLIDKKNHQLLVTLEGGYVLSYKLKDLSFRKAQALPCGPAHIKLSKDGEKIFIGCAARLLSLKTHAAFLVIHAKSLKIKNIVKKRLWFCRGIALSHRETMIYYVDTLGGVIRKLRTDDLHEESAIEVEDGIREVIEDPRLPLLYAGNFTKGYFYVIDLRSGKILKKIFVGQMVRSIYITPKTHRIFVATNYGVFEILRTSLPAR